MQMTPLPLYPLIYAAISFIPAILQCIMLIFRILAKTQFMWPLGSPFHPSDTNSCYRFLPEYGHDELIAANYRRSMGKPDDGELVGCAVCLCPIEEGEEIWELACDHVFHRECLDTWLRYGRISCPLCREPVPWIMARNLGCREEAEIEELFSPYSSFLGHNFWQSL
ncbi:hypothetical protein AAC387_Pa02g4779 [Persea americana]